MPAARNLVGELGSGDSGHPKTRDQYQSKEELAPHSPKRKMESVTGRGRWEARVGRRWQSARFGDVSRASQSMKKK